MQNSVEVRLKEFIEKGNMMVFGNVKEVCSLFKQMH